MEKDQVFFIGRDVWLSICSFLSLFELIRVRKSCKTLSQWITNRFVWNLWKEYLIDPLLPLPENDQEIQDHLNSRVSILNKKPIERKIGAYTKDYLWEFQGYDLKQKIYLIERTHKRTKETKQFRSIRNLSQKSQLESNYLFVTKLDIHLHEPDTYYFVDEELTILQKIEPIYGACFKSELLSNLKRPNLVYDSDVSIIYEELSVENGQVVSKTKETASKFGTTQGVYFDSELSLYFKEFNLKLLVHGKEEKEIKKFFIEPVASFRIENCIYVLYNDYNHPRKLKLCKISLSSKLEFVSIETFIIDIQVKNIEHFFLRCGIVVINHKPDLIIDLLKIKKLES